MRLVVPDRVELLHLQALLDDPQVAVGSRCIDGINLRISFFFEIGDFQISQGTILLDSISSLKHPLLSLDIKLHQIILSHLRMGINILPILLIIDNHVQLMIFLLSCTKQVPVLTEAHRGKGRNSIEVLYLQADHFFFVFVVAEEELDLEDVAQLAAYEEEEAFEFVDAVAGELGLSALRAVLS